jgi:hypothetical protein
VTYIVPGSHVITAAYSGDTDFTLVVKDPVTVKVLVIPGRAVAGLPVLATAVLSGGDSRGTVSFCTTLAPSRRRPLSHGGCARLAHGACPAAPGRPPRLTRRA